MKTFKTARKTAGLAGLAVAAMAAGPVKATEGYYALGYSASQRGMAGAGIAYSIDAMSPAVNPANAASVGKEFSLGLQLFSPKRGYEGTNTTFVPSGTVDSGNNYFLVPNFAYNVPLANGNVLNFAAYGNGGMNTSYPTGLSGCGSVFCGGPAGADLEQLFLSVTYAGKVGNLSWGIAPTFAVQRFSAWGLGAFSQMSVSPTNLTNNGYDFSTGVGVRLGAKYDVNQQLALGATFQSKMNMSNFSKYSGLFPDGGNFNIPAVVGVGAAFRPTSDVTIDLDLQRIFYSGVAALGDAAYTAPLGAPGGMGFGWSDVNVAKIGVAWKSSPDMTWRAGYAYSSNPVPASAAMLNILAPGIVQNEFTFGGTRKLSNRDKLDFAVEYVPEATLTGPEAMTPAPGTVKLFMSQFALSVGWTRSF